jgi:hydrogenase maturation factor HypF (carbamoyltransferase family)
MLFDHSSTYIIIVKFQWELFLCTTSLIREADWVATLGSFCISVFNSLIDFIEKQTIPQDVAWKALQFLKNGLFHIWDNTKEISLLIEKMTFFGTVAQNFAFLETISTQLK